MGLKFLIPVVAGGVVLAQAVYFATKSTKELLRPPGAKDEKDFMSKCVRCGRCIEACPYVCLKAATDLDGIAVGTPIIDMRKKACQLCEDFPCVNACPTQALSGIETREDVDMGLAVIDTELCIAMSSMRCEVCYRVCPLIDEAITIDYRLRTDDGIHAVFAPIIDEEKCVGCGLCVERCVVGPPNAPDVAIKIVRDRQKAIAETKEQNDKWAAKQGS